MVQTVIVTIGLIAIVATVVFGFINFNREKELERNKLDEDLAEEVVVVEQKPTVVVENVEVKLEDAVKAPAKKKNYKRRSTPKPSNIQTGKTTPTTKKK